MGIDVTVNGIAYTIPEVEDTNWGGEVTDWAVAISAATLQKAGGNFTLLADVDFGAGYGLKSAYYKSRSSNVASAGEIRLANSDSIDFRNNANSADLSLSVNSSDQLEWDGALNVEDLNVSDDITVDDRLTVHGNFYQDGTAFTVVSADLNVALGDIYSTGGRILTKDLRVNNETILTGPMTATSGTFSETLTISGVPVPIIPAGSEWEDGYIKGGQISIEPNSRQELHVQPVKCRGSNDAVNITTTVSGMKDFSSSWTAGYGNGGLASGATRSADTGYYFFIISQNDGTTVDYGWDDDESATNLLSDAGGSYTDYRALAYTPSQASGDLRSITHHAGDLDYWKYEYPYVAWTPANITTTAQTSDISGHVPPNTVVDLKVYVDGSSGLVYGLIYNPESASVSIPPPTLFGYSFFQTASGDPEDFATKVITSSNGSIAVVSDDASGTVDLNIYIEGYRWNRGRE